ncbi:response regulator [Marinomonas agarivorans]|nr:response regulator [Marinomonas agarivorans]
MKHNVLVVDDESQILSALKRTLRNQDFSLLTANDGEEALAILADHQVDLIISDYMMPGLSGTELLTKAEEIQPDSIRMILSGHSDFQNVMASMKSGIVHKFLAKPWSNSVLIKQINDSLATKTLAEENSQADITSNNQKASSASGFYEIHTDLEHTILDMAPELENVFGYTQAEVEGQPIALLITERSYQQHLDYLATKDGNAENWKASAKNRIAQTKAKKPFPISLAVSKSNEVMTYFIKSLASNDAVQAQTKPVSVENQSNKEEIYTTNNAYVLLDKEGKMSKFNQKFTDLFGGLIVPNIGSEFTPFMQSCLQQDFYPESELDQEKWLQTFLAFDDAIECEFQHDQMIVVTPHKNADGSVTLEHALQDLDLENMLNKALDEAKLAAQEKKALFGRLDKDVVTPMSDGVLASLEKLKAAELAPEQQEHLDLALKSGKDILTSLHDITANSGVQSDSI